mmetsp:Transcript_69610/g.175873  ORF Transcript_69610/g.175873 Transcript_69610/m.175873 type:complete len:644 (+) Transcript_69610:207-2138(+)|eukprot:CAMPEP_0115452718 /NCGR_PEP_ID=MMETSP0271-20121206/42740_1 /TAXON_ID=71861 /ORGANISM="Scrippsiella trochoidea, Strain CCMP3099" /LENGTH=643 /DNA_ID=CAMNT_0002879057 /DNA_START=95 /DNA_END=2026 /DNA_ORIENTATION=+
MTGSRGDSYRGRGGDKKLDYAKRQITDEEVNRLQLWKQQHYSYEEVDFSCNELSAAGLRVVLDLCRRCEKLRILRLYKNRIDDQGAEGLAELVERCPSIEEMHLSHNHFSGDGVLKIITAADRSRVKHLPPLWLRLEQNDVQNPVQTIKEMMRSLSVCDRRDEKKCTNRVCCWDRKIHLPFFQLQRGTHSVKGRGKGGDSGALQEERRQPVVLTARFDVDAPLSDGFDRKGESTLRLDSRQREDPDRFVRKISPSLSRRERHTRERRRRAALRDGFERHRRGSRRSPSFRSSTPSPRRTITRRVLPRLPLASDCGNRGGVHLCEASRPRRHHRGRHRHRQVTTSADLPAFPGDVSAGKRSHRRLRSPAHLDHRAEVKRRRLGHDEVAKLGKRTRRDQFSSGGDRGRGRRRHHEHSRLHSSHVASVDGAGGMALQARRAPAERRAIVGGGGGGSGDGSGCGGGGDSAGVDGGRDGAAVPDAPTTGAAPPALPSVAAAMTATSQPHGSHLPGSAAPHADRSPSSSGSSSTGSSSISSSSSDAAIVAVGAPALGGTEAWTEEPAWGSPSPSSECRWNEDRGCPPPSPSPVAGPFLSPGTTKSLGQANHGSSSGQGPVDGMSSGVKERMSMLKERLTQKWQGSKASA